MAEQNQIIVEPVVSSGASKGSRKQDNLTSCFAASPIYTGDMSNEERKKLHTMSHVSVINEVTSR